MAGLQVFEKILLDGREAGFQETRAGLPVPRPTEARALGMSVRRKRARYAYCETCASLAAFMSFSACIFFNSRQRLY